MKKHFILLFLISIVAVAYSQPNCNAYRYAGDTLKYRACNKALEISGLYQFGKTYQMILDEAIAIDPTFDYAYWAKSIAYLKSGDFITWKKLIDKAVELNPYEHMGYRGWCRYQFFRDYNGAIRDFDKYARLLNYDIGYSQNGDYHLNIVKAICYRALGDNHKALEIMNLHMQNGGYSPGPYDYIHLGALYIALGDYPKALEALNKQEKLNDLAENHYYAGVAYQYLNQHNKAQEQLTEAKLLYEVGKKMKDSYTHPYDQVYLSEILGKLSKYENEARH